MEEGHRHHQRDRVNDEDDDEREEEEEERTGGRGRRTLNLFSFDRGGEEEKNEITAQNADLVNRVALVTGCTSGIGKQVVLDLALAGAKVVFGCRNLKKAGEVKREMMEKFPHLDLVVMEGVALDVSSGESIAKFAQRFNETIGELDVLVNNAGVASEKGYERETGVSKLVWTNFLGPAVLMLSLNESFQRAIGRRQFANCVFVASVCHRFGKIEGADMCNKFLYNEKFGSYSDTKLACVAFANEVEYRWGARGVRCSSVDPGAVRTPIFSSVRLLRFLPLACLRRMCYAPAEDGARAVTIAALNPFAPQNASLNATPQMRRMDQGARHFSRGLFAGRFVQKYGPGKFPSSVEVRNSDGDDSTPQSLDAFFLNLRRFRWHVHALFFAIGVIAISLVDWPLRKFFKGQKFDGTKVVESSEASYDPVLGTELWEIAKEFSGVVEPAYGERFTSNDMFSEEFLEQLFPNELSMEEHLKVMEETATNLGIEMKHIDATKLRKKDKGDSDANDGSDSDGKSVKTKKKKHKRSGSFFRRSQENLTKID
jgi:NAD(P)-dependent dehydrogenase (short-subunit alcohol dehydrogenase family)